MHDFKEDHEVWDYCNIEDLWIYDKLIVSRRLGYTCGPIGTEVPHPGEYIVRPITNLLGMGRGATFEHIENETDHLPLGYFWCEIFKGRHLSVDYIDETQVLCVEGFRDPSAPIYRWSRWERVDDVVPFPIHEWLTGYYKNINCEFIGDKLIEVHLRLNPDFDDNTQSLDVVWEDDNREPNIVSPDYKRKGFIKNRG